MTHGLGHAVHESIRGGVLEALGLFVHILPAESKVLYQVRFNDPVAPQDLQRLAAPGAREPNAAVRFVFQEPVLGKPADHAAHRRRLHVQHPGELAGSGGLTALVEGIDSLEIVFHGTGQASELHDAR